MCERICPKCGSEKHAATYSLIGTSITCMNCGLILQFNRDEQAAPTWLKTQEDIDVWVAEGSFVTPGAEEIKK